MKFNLNKKKTLLNYHKYKQNIKYGFKDLISKQIISQFQFLWGLKISVKTALKLYFIKPIYINHTLNV